MTPADLIAKLIIDQRWQDIIDLILSDKYGGAFIATNENGIHSRLAEVSHQLHFVMKHGGYGKKEVEHNGKIYVSTFPNAVSEWLKDGAPGVSQDQVDSFVEKNGKA